MAQQPADSGRTKDAVPPQDSTAKIPMFDLETAIKVVEAIREKAVETAPLAKVAEALGYANATSTPFYRRIAAARIFGLLSAGAALTQEAIDYIKPHDEQMKAKVITAAIMGIPAYRGLIERYAGKKINIELVANAIEKEQNLTHSCALTCARVFESSLRFAGMLSADGCVQARPDDAPHEVPPAQATPQTVAEGRLLQAHAINDVDTQQHTLFLDRSKTRTFSFSGPVEVTEAEYERICQWLKVTMIVAANTEGKI